MHAGGAHNAASQWPGAAAQSTAGGTAARPLPTPHSLRPGPAALALFLSPGKAVLRARSERVLGVSQQRWCKLCLCGGMGHLCELQRQPTCVCCHLLQDLNPLPFPTLTANCVGWVAYSYVARDALVLWPNMCGVLLGLFYFLSCYGLAGGWNNGWELPGGLVAMRPLVQIDG